MEGELRTPQVLSLPISSICAVISNYWRLIEVHVEHSPSLSSRQMNTRRSPITQSDTPGDPTCHLNLPLQLHSFLSSSPPPQFQETAGTLWCLTGLVLGHLHCCIWQGIYSGCWNPFPYGTILLIPAMSFLCCFVTPKKNHSLPKLQRRFDCLTQWTTCSVFAWIIHWSFIRLKSINQK